MKTPLSYFESKEELLKSMDLFLDVNNILHIPMSYISEGKEFYTYQSIITNNSNPWYIEVSNSENNGWYFKCSYNKKSEENSSVFTAVDEIESTNFSHLFDFFKKHKIIISILEPPNLN